MVISKALLRRVLACPLRGTALVNQTPAAPGFGPAGFHPQASGPSWAGALRLRSYLIPEQPSKTLPTRPTWCAPPAGSCGVNMPDL